MQELRKIRGLLDKALKKIDRYAQVEATTEVAKEVKRTMSPFARTVPMNQYVSYLSEITIELWGVDREGKLVTKLAASEYPEFLIVGEDGLRAPGTVKLRGRAFGFARAIVVRSAKNPLFYFVGTCGKFGCDVNMPSTCIEPSSDSLIYINHFALRSL